MSICDSLMLPRCDEFSTGRPLRHPPHIRAAFAGAAISPMSSFSRNLKVLATPLGFRLLSSWFILMHPLRVRHKVVRAPAPSTWGKRPNLFGAVKVGLCDLNLSLSDNSGFHYPCPRYLILSASLSLCGVDPSPLLRA